MDVCWDTLTKMGLIYHVSFKVTVSFFFQKEKTYVKYLMKQNIFSA